MSTSPVLDQLAAVRAAYPDAPLVVFVPTLQNGHALETDLARRRGGIHGVDALPVERYAQQVARRSILTSERTPIRSIDHLFYSAGILQEMASSLEASSAPGAHHLSRTVAEAVHTLRLDAIDPVRLREYASEPGTEDTLRIVSDAYDAYIDRLDAHRLYDEADVLSWAEERVRSGTVPEVTETVYVALNSVTLSERAARFVHSLRPVAKDFLRAGVSAPQTAPRESVLVRFADVPRVEGDAASGGADDRSSPSAVPGFVRTVGMLSEADAVMRDILNADVPFDDVTIAYTTGRPYATLLPDRAQRAGIPVISGAGQPAMTTQTGLSLDRLYEWVREDFAAAPLIAMLRAGLLRISDREARVSDSPDLTPARAATLIAQRSYEAGREGLLTGLARAVDQAREREEETGSEKAAARLRERSAVFEHVLLLVDLIQPGTMRPASDDQTTALDRVDQSRLNRSVSLESMADGTLRFLRSFGPTDDSDKPEKDRTLDEAARRRLYEELEDLKHAPVSLTDDAGRVASLLQKWLSAQNVQPQQARPGHVHILPLDAVGYSDRSHLYVVGMDGVSFDAPVGENGLLPDGDRQMLQSLDGEEASLSAADELLWRTEQALARHRGPVTFYTRTFDVMAGEECDPSAFFLARERRAGQRAETRTVPLIPGSGDLALSNRDAWLAAYRQRGDSTDRTQPTARDHLAEQYPAILNGEAARDARASEEYTDHDGLLPAGEYPELDLFSDTAEPVSASRLQTLAEAPYIYFLKYVLGVEPLEEPALDDEPWLNSLRKGSLLHTVYERFVRDLDGRVPEAADADRLLEIVDDALEEESERFEPSSEMVLASARRELIQNVRVFFRAEMQRDRSVVPEDFELGFGMEGQENNAHPVAELSVGDHTLAIRGTIDRLDRHNETGALSIWDYKTGRAASYDESDPLQNGKTLQWALYAYALEALTSETVERAGYFFANTTEVGARIGFSPADHRTEAETILTRLRDLTRTGTFPVAPHLEGVTAWKWNGYDRLVKDLATRRKEVRPKARNYPGDRPLPPTF
ncbi:MAG: PD-(D/E)XK nuclease family protein [Bacteroidetes bacterium]|jgi:RecB family exonuclease|nr:PD-(D/E)XK nuclease family protein [Bacteroidota bacterium]